MIHSSAKCVSFVLLLLLCAWAALGIALTGGVIWFCITQIQRMLT